ncbi:hypothetical protein GGR55DRAFT_646964 [Xylaria sp. FL0064]|nr:hypothetical protein GGR55DRAFT_646964 [Xylaria sp. FL0064]
MSPQPGLRPGGHGGRSQHSASLSQVSEYKMPPSYENHLQTSLTAQALIENTRNSLQHVQGELSLESIQNSQQPQKSEEMSPKFDSIAPAPGISDLPGNGNGALQALSPNYTPGSLTSNPYSEISEGMPLNVALDLGFSTWDPFAHSTSTSSIELDGYGDLLHSSSFCWDTVEPDFGEPSAIDASLFSLDLADQCKHGSQPSAFNAINKEGESLRPPAIIRSPSSLTREAHREELTGWESYQSNTDDIKQPLGESAEGFSLSNSTPRSADESTASSDYEDDVSSDTSGDIFKPLTQLLLQKLLSAYFRYTHDRKAGEGDAKEPNNSRVPDSAISVSTGKETVSDYQYPRNSNPTKRKRQNLSQNSGNGEDEDQEEELPPRKRMESLKEDALLACPFAKWKPLSYQSCYKYIMKDIRRVKQHLRRSHKRPLHCPTCWETFKVEEVFYSHIESRSCLPRPKRALEGVSSTQQEHLDRKVDRKLSRSDQWYSIFSILFPDSPRPRSAYLESDLSAELLDFQKFMATDGLDIVEQTAYEQIPASLIPQTEEIVTFSQVLFQQAIPEILKKYEATRQHNSSPDSGYGGLYFPSSSNSMPDEHNVVSGPPPPGAAPGPPGQWLYMPRRAGSMLLLYSP